MRERPLVNALIEQALCQHNYPNFVECVHLPPVMVEYQWHNNCDGAEDFPTNNRFLNEVHCRSAQRWPGGFKKEWSYSCEKQLWKSAKNR